MNAADQWQASCDSGLISRGSKCRAEPCKLLSNFCKGVTSPNSRNYELASFDPSVKFCPIW
jgi:hypothetical protein